MDFKIFFFFNSNFNCTIFKNSNDFTECCIIGYKYSTVGYISMYSNDDFSSLKNDLFDFQLSNELEIFYAVFGKTICFGNSISILQLH